MQIQNLTFSQVSPAVLVAPLFYYKCLDCLTPVALETRSTEDLFCDCGSNNRFEYMGRVQANGDITKQEEQCKCNSSCTHASGPSCDCECGGRNHGHGRKAYIVVDKVTGKARQHIKVNEKSIAHAVWFRDVLAQMAQTSFLGILEDAALRRGPTDWTAQRRLWSVQTLIRKFKYAKTFKGREKILADIKKYTEAGNAQA